MEALRWPMAGETSDHMGRSRCRAPLAPGIMGGMSVSRSMPWSARSASSPRTPCGGGRTRLVEESALCRLRSLSDRPEPYRGGSGSCGGSGDLRSVPQPHNGVSASPSPGPATSCPLASRPTSSCDETVLRISGVPEAACDSRSSSDLVAASMHGMAGIRGVSPPDVSLRDAAPRGDALRGASPHDPPSDPRRRPYRGFGPVQAVAVMMVLLCAFSASVTMLVTRSVNTAATSSVARSASPMSPSAAGEEESRNSPQTIETQPVATQNPQNHTEEGENESEPSPTAEPLDLNGADESDLDALPGVGPVLAGRIMDHRRSVGRFDSVDQLRDVSGIGAKTMERLRPLVKVS